MTYYVRLSSPQRFPAIPAPRRRLKMSHLWEELWDGIPYRVRTWWENRKRRWRWRDYSLVKCTDCDLLHLRYRVRWVQMWDLSYEPLCAECRGARTVYRLVNDRWEAK